MVSKKESVSSCHSLLSPSASASTDDPGYRLATKTIVHGKGESNDPINAISIELNISCNATQHTSSPVTLNVSLGSVNPFGLALSSGAKDNNLWLTKSTSPYPFTVPLRLTPCPKTAMVYNALRTFHVTPGSGHLTVANGTEAAYLCFAAGPNGTIVSVPCQGKDKIDEWVWQPTNATRIRASVRTSIQGTIRRHDASDTCLGVLGTGTRDCPPLSYPDPPPCRSRQWEVLALPCGTKAANVSFLWHFDSVLGHLESLLPAALKTEGGRCLTATPPLATNNVTVHLTVNDSQGRPLIIEPSSATAKDGTETLLIPASCGQQFILAMGVASERDAARSAGEISGPEHLAARWAAEAPVRHLAHSRGDGPDVAAWQDYWSTSRVDLGPAYPLLGAFVETMLYFAHSTMRAGSVGPGLWGPWCGTDEPSWGDEYTLDYNVEANYWGLSTANHAEYLHIYTDTISSLIHPQGKERATHPDWSYGGWSDVFGAEVQGMGCGFTQDWDHMYGCPSGYGGFKGVEFASATGPFPGMQFFSDDSCRFVAGLTVTPMIQ